MANIGDDTTPPSGDVPRDSLLDVQLGDYLVISGGQSATRVCGIALRQDQSPGPLLIVDAYEYNVPGDVLDQYLVNLNADNTTHNHPHAYNFKFNANVQMNREKDDEKGKESQLVELARGVAHLTYAVWHEECGRTIEGGDYACELEESYQTEERTVETSLFHNCDIGLASAVLFGWLYSSYQPSVSVTLSNLCNVAAHYATDRQKHITPLNTIHRPYDVYPRRLWDIHANRVVPFYIISQTISSFPPFFLVITHSWRQQSELIYHETPINSFAWPVPLPAGLDLETVRRDIMKHELSQRFRYVWLDVLCMRQASAGDGLNIPPSRTAGVDSASYGWRKKIDRIHEGDKGWLAALSLTRDHDGSLRRNELAIDVPTIGNIYVKAGRVLRYFNGLGRPLELTGWDHGTHWLNRAWTIQEHVRDTLDFGVENIAGCHLNMRVTRGGVTRRIREHLQDVYQAVIADRGIIAMAAEMGRRSATTQLDKIAGLSYVLQLPELPVYQSSTDVLLAWRSCLVLLPPKLVVELFFNCPVSDDQLYSWTPKWMTLSQLPRSFVPYPPIDESRLAADANSRGTMNCRVLCLFPTSMRRVEGTDVDYAINLGPQYNNVKLFIGHDGLELPKVNEYKTRWLLARAECMGPDSKSQSDWIGSWVLLAEKKDDVEQSYPAGVATGAMSDQASMYCRKLASFRCDTNFAGWIHVPGWIEVSVNYGGLIRLWTDKRSLDWMATKPLILDA